MVNNGFLRGLKLETERRLCNLSLSITAIIFDFTGLWAVKQVELPSAIKSKFPHYQNVWSTLLLPQRFITLIDTSIYTWDLHVYYDADCEHM